MRQKFSQNGGKRICTSFKQINGMYHSQKLNKVGFTSHSILPVYLGGYCKDKPIVKTTSDYIKELLKGMTYMIFE